MELTVFSPLALSAPALGVATHWVGPGAGGFGFLWLLIPLFWIAVLALVFGVFGRRMRRARWGGYGPWDQQTRSAESSLAERYAQGDIDEKEYRARLEVLRASNPQPPR
jgi:putative membrane protein